MIGKRRARIKGSDPFGERSLRLTRRPMQLMGGRFRFESNSGRLLRLVDSAYAGLPPHRLSESAPELKVSLVLTRNPDAEPRKQRRGSEPPPVRMLEGAGLLGGATAGSSFVIMSPRERAALVAISPQMLEFPYHARYELIEFAVFTLAFRTQSLLPMHAACVGHRGRGVLLMGPSGAGKSTVALHCLLDGLEFLTEDGAFLAPRTMLATGVPNFIHIRADSLRWLGRSLEAAKIRNSPVIRRRSGVEKFEVNLRRAPFRLAQSPLKIVAIVFLSARGAADRALLRPLRQREVLDKVARAQGYAVNQPQWRDFRANLSRLDAFELRRGRHPREAVEALRELLASG
jgi:hypothetical protein